jgi:hypothetical protein
MLHALLGPKFWIEIGSDIATSSHVPELSMLDRVPKEPAGAAAAEPEAQDMMAVQMPGAQGAA